jgi:CubicO group peptidase (beta-lactamase class C family)
VSILVGMLIAEEKIASLDAPLSTWYGEFAEGRKADVTLRHVLTHTSGLEHRRGAGVLNEQRDRLAFVRKSPVVDEPGAKFSYSNEAVQLLSGIIRAAAGTPLDAYADRALFAPLGVGEHSWDKDGAGNVQTFYGLALSARDLGRIGQLMLQKGEWKGEQLVPAEWVDASTHPAEGTPEHGLLWWIRRARGSVSIPGAEIDALATRGFDAADALRSLAGQAFHSHAALWMSAGNLLDEASRVALARLLEAGTKPFVETPGSVIGFAADGWLGQQLIVFPAHRLVAVRQHRAPSDGSADDAYNQAHGFFDLAKRLERALPQR